MNMTKLSATITTMYQECLHCVGFGIAQSKGKLTDTLLMNSDEFSKAFRSSCNVDVSEINLWDFAQAKPNWVKSVVKAVNAGRKSGMMKKGGYTFYRSNGMMKQVYDTFKQMAKKDGVKLNADKWNPGDIWASTIKKLDHTKYDSVLEFNAYLASLLKNQTLVGISLKGIKPKDTVKVKHEGIPNQPVVAVGYKGIEKTATAGPFPTGINIITTKGSYTINIRTFSMSSQSDVRGEILKKGGGARHGKVGQAVFNAIIKDEGISQMQKARIGAMNDDNLKKYAQVLWRDCGHSYSDDDVEKYWAKNPLVYRKKERDRVGYWQSLIHSLELGAFLNTHKGKADDIVNKMFISAASKSDLSSEFIKIY